MPRINHIISIPDEQGIDVYQPVKEYGYGLYETMGKRDSQEDAAYACWYTKEHFKSLTPQEIGRRLWTSYRCMNLGREFMNGGTTASTTVYDGQRNLITATLADSVAFAAVYDKNGKLAGVVRLNNVIHHPAAESQRINRAGGMIRSGRINGRLAVSRAIGDADYNPAVVCADASIDINRLDDIYAKLSISPDDVGSVKVITTCDGFTEPLKQDQTKTAHEQWLENCLREIPLSGNLKEHELARKLATRALECFSQDNISIAVQTLSASDPFLTGIYDGHGGDGAATFVAQNIGAFFDGQCSLSHETYTKQMLSAERNCVTYYRDNKDHLWYEPLAELEKQSRTAQLSKPNGIRARLESLKAKIEELQEQPREEESSDFMGLVAAKNIFVAMDILCEQYLNLNLSDKEFVECAKCVFDNGTSLNFKSLYGTKIIFPAHPMQ